MSTAILFHRGLLCLPLCCVFIWFGCNNNYQPDQTQRNLELLHLNVVRHNWEQFTIEPQYNHPPAVAMAEKIAVLNAKGILVRAYQGHDATIPDTQLGSAEALTVRFCAMPEGGVSEICRETTIYASPKDIQSQPHVTYPLNNQLYKGRYDLGIIATRPRFGHPEERERIPVSHLSGSIKLAPKAGQTAMNIPIVGAKGEFDLHERNGYSAFKQEVQGMVYEGNMDFTVEVEVKNGGTTLFSGVTLLETPKALAEALIPAHPTVVATDVPTKRPSLAVPVVLNAPTIATPEPVAPKTEKESSELRAMATKLALKAAPYIIHLVFHDRVERRTVVLHSSKYEPDTHRYVIQMSVRWKDEWMTDPYEIGGTLITNEDGTDVSFRILNKNSAVEALEIVNDQTLAADFRWHKL